MESKEVAWAVTMPLPLRGGPLSDTQKAYKEGRLQEPDTTAMVSTSAGEASISMTPEKISCPYGPECRGNHANCKAGDVMKGYCRGGRVGYEMGGAVAPMPISMRKKGFQMGGATTAPYQNEAGGSTGQSNPNIIQSNKTVNTKKFVDHEGEYYANAPLVQILGGPEATESILLNEARKKIRSRIQPNNNATPIMNKEDVKVAVSPGGSAAPAPIGSARVKAQDGSPLPGAGEGGVTEDPNNPPALPKPVMSITAAPDTQLQKANTPNVLQTPPPPPPPPPEEDDGEVNIKTFPIMPILGADGLSDDERNNPLPIPVEKFDESSDYTKPTQSNIDPDNPTLPAPVVSNDRAELDQARAAGFNSIADYNAATAAGQNANTYYSALPKVRPETSAANNLLKKNGITINAEEQRFLDTATREQIANFLKQKGIAVGDSTATNATATPTAGKYDAQVDAALKMLSDYAAGKNPLMDSIINETMQQYGSDSAGGMEALKMDLAGRGITGAAAEAILASYGRNSRIGENKLRTDFAQKVMEDAKSASRDLLSQTIGLQQSERSQLNTAMATAFEAGDYKTGASLYKRIYGVDLDTSKIANTTATKDIDAGTATILAAFRLDPAVTLNSALGQTHLKPGLERIWNATHPGQPMNEDWANKYVEDMRVSQTPIYQMMNSISEADALKLYFGGDKNRMDNYVNEATGETGFKGFQSALPGMYSNVGAIVRKPDGTIDIDFSKLMAGFPSMETTQDVATGIGGEALKVGGVTEINNKNYTITADNGDGTYTATIDGTLYTIKPSVEAGKFLVKKGGKASTNGSTTPTNTQLYVDKDGNVVTDGTGHAVVGGADGQPIKVSVDGKDEYVFKVGDKYNTKFDGSGNEVNLSDPAKPVVVMKNVVGGKIYDTTTGKEIVWSPELGVTGEVKYQAQGTLGPIGVDDNGNYFQVTGTNQTGKYTIEQAIKDKTTLGDKFETVINGLVKTGNAGETQQLYEDYLEIIGEGNTPDTDVLLAFASQNVAAAKKKIQELAISSPSTIVPGSKLYEALSATAKATTQSNGAEAFNSGVSNYETVDGKMTLKKNLSSKANGQTVKLADGRIAVITGYTANTNPRSSASSTFTYKILGTNETGTIYEG